MTAAASTFITAASLRSRTVRQALPGGWGEPREITDLRGTPVGDRAEVWEWDRLVPPRRGNSRRVREHVKVMHCPEGWHSTSGLVDQPHGPEICSTLLGGQWAEEFPARFNRYHLEHPVLWIVRVRVHSSVTVSRYCDPELPGEYRPGGQDDASA